MVSAWGLENLGATSDIFDDGPNENTSLAVKDAAVDTVMEMFAGDRKLQKEIQEKWGRCARVSSGCRTGIII